MNIQQEIAARRLFAYLEAAREPVVEIAAIRCECGGTDADCVLTDLSNAAQAFLTAVANALEGPGPTKGARP